MRQRKRKSGRRRQLRLTPEVVEQLKQLGELHEQDVLSDEEFQREKAKLLGPA